MKAIAVALLVSAFALGAMTAPVSAQDLAQTLAACQAKAVSKDGKPLSGAASRRSIKQCMRPFCELDAKDRVLTGVARTSFLKRCEGG